MRRLGVYGDNLPTKKPGSVQPADFLVGGIMAFFTRKFDQAFLVRSRSEAMAIFDGHDYSSMYGWDELDLFFANAKGVPASLYVAAHVGYTGSAIDAVQASVSVPDGNSQNPYSAKAAYQGVSEYGVSGNRTGFTVEQGDRFSTSSGETSNASATSLKLASVAGIRKGDLIKAVCTGSGSGTVWLKVASVDEANSKVNFAAPIGAVYPQSGDPVTVPGFKIRTWRKSVSGNVQEVDVQLGKTWLTTESDVVDFYAPNVFAQSSWLTLVPGATTSPLDTKFPAANATITYLASGADGTAPTTSAHWDRTVHLFDNLPVRILTNPETTVAAIHAAGEAYCKGRQDLPKWLPVVAEGRTKAQLVAIGNGFQRSDDVLMALVAQWLQVEDPFSSSPLASPRVVPNVGAVLGAYFRTVAQKGIHYIPTKDMSIVGAVDVDGDQILDDFDRTDLAAAGVNCLQNLPGYGIVIRNFFTPSTSKEFKFFNGIMMREYIKVSAVQSLQGSENSPNSIQRIREDASAIDVFMRRLWDRGSTGNVPEGETFGQFQNEDGTLTKYGDHVEIEADIVNNPVSGVEDGERNIDVHFTYPAPGGSIKIGVGIMLRG